MDVLLISTNRLQEPMPVLPIGLAYVARALKDAGHSPRILDLFWEEDPRAAIRAAIAEKRPDLVGIGIRNTDDYILDPPSLFLPDIREAVEAVKDAGVDGERIVAGGAALGTLRESLLRFIGVRYGCIGDGEDVAVSVADRIGRGEPIAGLPGIGCVDGDRYFEAPFRAVDIRTRPPPDWSVYDRRYFTTPNRYGMKASVGILTKRGCEYRCVYCTVPAMHGTEFRLRDPKLVVDELAEVAERFSGAEIEFIDNDFNVPPDHAEAICTEIQRRGVRREWTCAVHPTFVSKALLGRMREAGCKAVDVGIDSASATMIRNLGRPPYARQALFDLNDWCKELGIATTWACLIGGPGECRRTLAETFSTLEELNPVGKEGWPAVLLYGGIRIYPGTGIHRIAVAEGLLHEGHPVLFPEYYMSRGLDESCYALIDSYKRKHAGWLFKGTALQRGLIRHGFLGGAAATAHAGARVSAPKPAASMPAAVPDISFPTLDDRTLPLRQSSDERLVLLIAWMKNRDDVRQWAQALPERLRHLPGVRLQVLGSIPPLPQFITRDFIKIQLKQAVSLSGPLLIDWDMQFTKGVLGLELAEKSVILAIGPGGRVALCEQRLFGEPQVSEVVQQIEGALASPSSVHASPGGNA